MPRKKKQGTLLQIAQLGNAVLRKKCRPVEEVRDPVVQALIDNLVATVMDVDGVGIAAPQVYVPTRLFIIASHPNPRYPQAPRMKPTAILNPRILARSKEMVKDWEGCLSIPGIRGLVPRHRWIQVSYTTREGVARRRRFADFVARIFQHECDHLEGVVFLDRVERTRDLVSEKEYQRMIARQTR